MRDEDTKGLYDATESWHRTYDIDRRKQILRSLRQAMKIMEMNGLERSEGAVGHPVLDELTWDDLKAAWVDYEDMRDQLLCAHRDWGKST
tara:strand:+ start:2662 stop:2931 length:270 start_codon:yes stop_codon:yes gene_type:complete